MVVKEESDAQVGFVTSREGDLNGSDETPDAAATRDKLNHALIQVQPHTLDHMPEL